MSNNIEGKVVVITGARRYLSETTRHAGQFDLVGAISSTLGMTALVYGLVHAAAAGWHDTQTLASLTAGVLLIVLLVWNEARAPQPIMPLRLFASRERSGAYAARMLFLGAMLGFWFFTTQFMQIVLGFSPFEAGLAYLATTLPNFAAAMAVPKLTRRFGNGQVLAGGLVIALLGMAWLSLLTSHTHFLTGIALPMVLIGIGQGGTLSPLTIAGVAGVAPQDAGAASGLVNVAHQLGGSLGLGVLVVVFAAAGSDALGLRELLAQRVGASLTVSAAMLAGALLIVFATIVRPERRRLLSAGAAM
ncbi:MAG TPA: MFS transporter [Rhodocyclaceae bacterium]|nr:MFS transporter [Rhodocyclaceae bacterium]